MADAHDQVAALKRLIEITGLLNTTLDLDELLQQIMSSAADLLGAETSSLLLVDEERSALASDAANRQPTTIRTERNWGRR